MHHPELYSIQEARKLLGGISRNTIYQLLAPLSTNRSRNSERLSRYRKRSKR